MTDEMNMKVALRDFKKAVLWETFCKSERTVSVPMLASEIALEAPNKHKSTQHKTLRAVFFAGGKKKLVRRTDNYNRGASSMAFYTVKIEVDIEAATPEEAANKAFVTKNRPEVEVFALDGSGQSWWVDSKKVAANT